MSKVDGIQSLLDTKSREDMVRIFLEDSSRPGRGMLLLKRLEHLVLFLLWIVGRGVYQTKSLLHFGLTYIRRGRRARCIY